MLMTILVFSMTTMTHIAGIKATVSEAAVKPPSLTEEKATMYLGGDKYQINLKNVSKKAKITYKSNNSAVANVNKTGKITAKKIGAAKISIKISEGKKSYKLSLYVNVIEKPIVKKELSAGELYAKCGPSTVKVSVDTGSVGAGFFISNDMVVTNYHVIEGARLIEVSTNNNKYTVSAIMGYNKELDIAILKTDALDHTYLLMNSADIVAGDKVYALGFPIELNGTMTETVISSASKVIEGADCIQTTSHLTYDNSGGALVNIYGEVIGINTMSATNQDYTIKIKELQKIDTNHPISLETYHENFTKTLLDGIPENAVIENPSKSRNIKSCQYVPSRGVVTGTLRTVDDVAIGGLIIGSLTNKGADAYIFEVTEECTLQGIIKSQTLQDSENINLVIYDINLNYVFTSSYERKVYQTLQVAISPGRYFAMVRTPAYNAKEDLPYQFMLTYK